MNAQAIAWNGDTLMKQQDKRQRMRPLGAFGILDKEGVAGIACNHHQCQLGNFIINSTPSQTWEICLAA